MNDLHILLVFTDPLLDDRCEWFDHDFVIQTKKVHFLVNNYGKWSEYHTI